MKYKNSFITIARKSQSPVSYDHIMLTLARIVIVAMLPALGFLLSSYLYAIQKDIARISDTQAAQSITLARIDESVRNIEQRLNKTENRLDNIKP